MKKIILIIIAALVFGGVFMFVKPQREISIQNSDKNKIVASPKSSGLLGEIKEIFTGALTNRRDDIFSPTKTNAPSDVPSNNISKTKPEDAVSEAIKSYLISSSNIGFLKDQSRLSLAIDLAALGEKQEIENIINEIKAKYVIFQALQPPPEAENIHQQSLKIIEIFISLLEKIKSSQREEIGKILSSAEVSQMQELVDKTKQEIQEIVGQYNIQLPPGVME